MKNRLLSAFLIVTIILFAGCGGGGGSSADTGDPTGLYSATLNSGGTGIGALIGDNAGNNILSMMTAAGSDQVGTLIADFADGSSATANIQNGRPVSVTDGTMTATFSNWSGTTVDVTLTGGGETETVNVDYSEFTAQALAASSVTKGWPQFFGALGTTISLAYCPIGLALAGVSMGLGFPAAAVGCTIAGTNLWRLLNNQPTLIEGIATYVSAPASCEAVVAGGSSASQQEQCLSDTLTTLPNIEAYVDENGNIVTNGGGTGGFAGSCTLSDGRTCVNYTGSDQTAAETQAGCQQVGGTYSSGACSTAGIVGYCTMGQGTDSEYRVVFYDNTYTTEVARDTCDVMGGVFTPQ